MTHNTCVISYDPKNFSFYFIFRCLVVVTVVLVATMVVVARPLYPLLLMALLVMELCPMLLVVLLVMELCPLLKVVSMVVVVMLCPSLFLVVYQL